MVQKIVIGLIFSVFSGTVFAEASGPNCTPVDLYVLYDQSSSVHEIDEARIALTGLLQKIPYAKNEYSPGYQVTLVKFAEEAKMVKKRSRQATEVLRELDRKIVLRDQESTDLHKALSEVIVDYQKNREEYNRKNISRRLAVLIVSDGITYSHEADMTLKEELENEYFGKLSILAAGKTIHFKPSKQRGQQKKGNESEQALLEEGDVPTYEQNHLENLATSGKVYESSQIAALSKELDFYFPGCQTEK